jgi:hypothetical protein
MRWLRSIEELAHGKHVHFPADVAVAEEQRIEHGGRCENLSGHDKHEGFLSRGGDGRRWLPELLIILEQSISYAMERPSLPPQRAPSER